MGVGGSPAGHVQKAAASLRRDPGLHSLLPYFAQFVAEKVTSNVGPNAMLAVLSNMVLLTESLLANENLFPEPYLYGNFDMFGGPIAHAFVLAACPRRTPRR